MILYGSSGINAKALTATILINHNMFTLPSTCTSRVAFWKFITSVYDGQKDITASNADEKLTALAEQAGVKGSEVATCAAKPETTTRVQHSIALGASLDVTGTPTLFVNGRKISNVGGLPYEILKGLTEFAAREGN